MRTQTKFLSGFYILFTLAAGLSQASNKHSSSDCCADLALSFQMAPNDRYCHLPVDASDPNSPNRYYMIHDGPCIATDPNLPIQQTSDFDKCSIAKSILEDSLNFDSDAVMPCPGECLRAEDPQDSECKQCTREDTRISINDTGLGQTCIVSAIIFCGCPE